MATLLMKSSGNPAVHILRASDSSYILIDDRLRLKKYLKCVHFKLFSWYSHIRGIYQCRARSAVRLTMLGCRRPRVLRGSSRKRDGSRRMVALAIVMSAHLQSIKTSVSFNSTMFWLCTSCYAPPKVRSVPVPSNRLWRTLRLICGVIST